MAHVWTHPCYELGFQKHVDTLTPSQLAFPRLLHAWLGEPRHQLVIVAGGPGSGKTYTVTQCLKHVQIPQLRMAYTARVACKMQGQTIHSAMKLNWSKGSVLDTLFKKLELETDPQACIRKSSSLLREFQCHARPQIVVIDEIGMVAHWLVYWIIQYFFQDSKPVLFVMMGDPNQLRPVKSEHNVFSVDMDMAVTRLDLVESARFTPAYAAVVRELRHCVDANNVTGMQSLICQHFPVVPHIDAGLLKTCTRAMAHKTCTVETYNNFYLKHLVPGPRIRLWNKDHDKYVDVKAGCHIFVTQNGVSKALNGTPLTFVKYDPDKDWCECQEPIEKDLICIHRNGKGEFPIAVGYAGTIHKFQGDTMDDAAIAINFDQSNNLHLMYTALSRVRTMQQIRAIQL